MKRLVTDDPKSLDARERRVAKALAAAPPTADVPEQHQRLWAAIDAERRARRNRTPSGLGLVVMAVLLALAGAALVHAVNAFRKGGNASDVPAARPPSVRAGASASP